ncbi:NAD-dependent epimerase/dehydratase family protein [Sphaerisporangium dianthi]|uniref:NAD-dependent epimerase/dehydratase family protein n=1 Tax=Sphaerisporangium dianthi TaxID=1436120 RepID=A0ABV9CM19_9ACTN
MQTARCGSPLSRTRARHSSMSRARVLVTGAGGFIGSHLVSSLKREGHAVRGADLKYPEFSPTSADEYIICDLREVREATPAFRDVDYVCALAADIGGMGHISKNEADILTNNTLISINSLRLATRYRVERFLFASSACVYPMTLQTAPESPALQEDAVLPADPQGAYGWEKLFSEQACRYYSEQHRLDVRVARLHNIYGPEGTYQGGREKAPAAICRKVAAAQPCDAIEIWGDGGQTRSFCYISDCVDALSRLLASNITQPVNIGSEEAISIESLARKIISVSGKKLDLRFTDGPEGVRGRTSDSTRAHRLLDWRPTTPLDAGLARTYEWIAAQLQRA